MYASIGKVPSPDSLGVFTYQFKSIEPDESRRKSLTLSSLASLGGPESQNLYIAVEAATVVQGNGVEFEVFHWSGRSERLFGGVVDDWAVLASFGLVGLLCCAGAALGIIYCIARRGDDDLDDGTTALQRQRQAQEAEEKAKKLYGQDYQQVAATSTTAGAAPLSTGGTVSFHNGGGSLSGAPLMMGNFASDGGGTMSGAPYGGGGGGGTMSQFGGAHATTFAGGRTATSAISYNEGNYDAQW